MNADVIIILGGGINSDGILSDESKFRVDKGVELFKSGVASKIIVSGKWGFLLNFEPVKTEADAMMEYIISLGVPSHVIVKESLSKDTIGNAYFCKINFLEINKWNNIIVVTSEYHIPRAKYVFEKVLGDNYLINVISADSKLSSENLEVQINKERKTLQFLKKWFDLINSGDTNAVKEFMYAKHPGYAENPEITKEQLLKILGRN